MKTKILTFLAIVILFSCKSNAQDDYVSELKSSLESYLNAGDMNDTKKLKPYLHSDFRVVLYDDKKDATSILDKSTYISFIKNKKFGGYKRHVNYQDIQTIGENMASINVILTSDGKPTLKNFYSLVRIKNKWLVLQDYVILIP